MALPDIWKSSESSPMRQLSRLQREVDRVFRDFMGPFSEGRFEKWLPTETLTFSPPCDVEETDTHYLLNFDLPGVKKDEIKIELVDNQLVVSGERKEEHEKKGKTSFQKERYYGAFQRVFQLPNVASADKVEANFQEGVLQIAIPKTAAAKSQLVKISEGPAKKAA